MTKRCPACGRWKQLDDFPRNRRTKDGYATYCKPCHNEKGRLNRIKNHGSARQYHLVARYGIGEDEAQRMYADQGGLCAVCGVAEAVHVDHDHDTGAVRKLLCFNCNGGLGQFKDDEALLRAAAAYLLAHDRVMAELASVVRRRLAALST